MFRGLHHGGEVGLNDVLEVASTADDRLAVDADGRGYVELFLRGREAAGVLPPRAVGQRPALMGRASRPKPAHLAEKLRRIRTDLGFSQNEMLRHLGLDEELFQGSI